MFKHRLAIIIIIVGQELHQQLKRDIFDDLREAKKEQKILHSLLEGRWDSDDPWIEDFNEKWELPKKSEDERLKEIDLSNKDYLGDMKMKMLDYSDIDGTSDLIKELEGENQRKEIQHKKFFVDDGNAFLDGWTSKTIKELKIKPLSFTESWREPQNNNHLRDNDELQFVKTANLQKKVRSKLKEISKSCQQKVLIETPDLLKPSQR